MEVYVSAKKNFKSLWHKKLCTMSTPAAAEDDASPDAGKWPTALVSVFQGLAVNAEEWAGSLTALKDANDALGHKYPDHVLEDCARPVSSHGSRCRRQECV